MPQLNSTIHALTEQARQREFSLRRREIATRTAEVDLKSMSDANAALKSAIEKQQFAERERDRSRRAREADRRVVLATTLEAARARESKALHEARRGRRQQRKLKEEFREHLAHREQKRLEEHAILIARIKQLEGQLAELQQRASSRKAKSAGDGEALRRALAENEELRRLVGESEAKHAKTQHALADATTRRTRAERDARAAADAVHAAEQRAEETAAKVRRLEDAHASVERELANARHKAKAQAAEAAIALERAVAASAADARREKDRGKREVRMMADAHRARVDALTKTHAEEIKGKEAVLAIAKVQAVEQSRAMLKAEQDGAWLRRERALVEQTQRTCAAQHEMKLAELERAKERWRADLEEAANAKVAASEAKATDAVRQLTDMRVQLAKAELAAEGSRRALDEERQRWGDEKAEMVGAHAARLQREAHDAGALRAREGAGAKAAAERAQADFERKLNGLMTVAERLRGALEKERQRATRAAAVGEQVAAKLKERGAQMAERLKDKDAVIHKAEQSLKTAKAHAQDREKKWSHAWHVQIQQSSCSGRMQHILQLTALDAHAGGVPCDASTGRSWRRPPRARSRTARGRTRPSRGWARRWTISSGPCGPSARPRSQTKASRPSSNRRRAGGGISCPRRGRRWTSCRAWPRRRRARTSATATTVRWRRAGARLALVGRR